MDKKRVNRILLLIIFLGLVVFSVSFVAAQSTAQQFFENIWKSWTAGEGVPELVGRILLAVIIALLVYSISDKIPGMSGEVGGKPVIRWVLSIIVAFLGTAYLQTAEIYLILFSYSALGFVLGAMLPFLILAFFSYDILSSKNLQAMWLKKTFVTGIWLVFGGFMVYRGVSAIGDISIPIPTIPWSYIIVGVVSIIIGFSIRSIYRKIRHGRTEEEKEKILQSARLSAAMQQADVERANKITES